MIEGKSPTTPTPKRRYHKITVKNDGNWSEWRKPVQRGFRLACCDCGLVHEYDFRVRNWMTDYRVRRLTRATASVRRGARIKDTIRRISEGLQRKPPKMET